MEETDGMGCLVPVGHRDIGEKLEQEDNGERMEQQALRVPLAKGVAG